MPNRFKMELYTVLMGPVIGASVNDTHFNAHAMVMVGGENDSQLNIFFLDKNSPVPNPPATVMENGKKGAICVPMEEMPAYIDILRNESPVFLLLYPDKPEFNHISTSWEKIGAGDDGW